MEKLILAFSMRESRFIQQNREKWEKYESGMGSGNLPPEEMESAFVELNDDLAYARTFYKNRAVRLFLNNLLTPVYSAIYKGKKWSWKSVRTFFVDEAPAVNYSARYFILVSFLVVVLGVCIGYFSTRYDSDFASVILGDRYVEVTENNISKGDPLNIYKEQDPGSMFTKIALNNLMVAVFFFVFGALFCVGTMFLLLQNGIVLGAFTWMFTSRGLTTEYLLTVYQHGTLEILGMVMEGAAGLMLGAGILFPGSYTRSRSMQLAARRSVIIFLVCVPIIIIAAFIESYLTRFTEINDVLRFMIILISFLIMLSYFIIYPLWKFRRTKQESATETATDAETRFSPEPGEVYTNSRTVLFSFDFLKNNSERIFLVAFSSLACMFVFVEFLSGGAITKDIQIWLNNILVGSGGGMADGLRTVAIANAFNFYASAYFFSHKVSGVVSLYSCIALSGIIYYVLWSNRDFLSKYGARKIPHVKIVVAAILAASIQVTLHILMESMWPLAMIFIFPIQIMAATYYCVSDSYNPIPAYGRAILLGLKSIIRIIGAIFIVMILYFVFMFGIYYLVLGLVSVSQQFHGQELISTGLLKFFAGINYLMIPILLFLAVYYYMMTALSVLEKNTGLYLQRKIDNLSFKKEVYGIATE